MKEFARATKPFDLAQHISAAANEIKNFTATFVFEDKRTSSGIFVNTGRFDGILTAHHVANALMRESDFGLCIADRPHTVILESAHCQHVPIGYPPNKAYGENGPDLSLIILRDETLLATLRSLKSFCYLDTKDLEYFAAPPEGLIWCISGSPHEATKLVSYSPTTGPLTRFQNFVGEATFHSKVTREGFDYLKLRVPHGEWNFPQNCKGMSGGGMWLVPLSTEGEDMNTLRHEPPILAGVSFHESDVEDNERVITGHGYDSIYTRLRQTLKELNRAV
jgi:hypothetical protein